MNKVLVATNKPFTRTAVRGIKNIVDNAGFEFVLLEGYANPEDIVGAVKDISAVIVRSDLISEEIIKAANNLKIIVRAGAGYDNIDLKVCNERGIIVMNTPGQNANAVAELAIGMLIYGVRNLFSGKTGNELIGQEIGICGFGHIGKLVAQIATKGFSMKVYIYDPFVSENDVRSRGFNICKTLADLFSNCRHISLHLPLNNETKKIIGYDLLTKMPGDGILINTARKEIINEDGLLKMFTEYSGLKYMSDVAPDCAKEFEERFKGRFFFTPKKIGAETEEANNNAGLAAANQIVKYFETGDITFKVN